jgi:aminopeptidase N
LLSRRVRAGQTVWTYEQPEPTSTYLATLQIGMYALRQIPKAPVRMQAVLPDRLRVRFDHDFGRQQAMMKLFIKLFGPYPFSAGYTVVVTDEPLEIPLEAQGVSIFGANHCDGTRNSERLIAHELAHQWFGNSVTARRWRDIWLHEGFACYAEWLWSEHSGGRTAAELAHQHHQRLLVAAQNLLLADPGPRDMFDDRVYKRGALTLHALRGVVGDEKFFALLRDWTTRHRHGTVVTDDFTGLAANYAEVSLRPLWQAWLYSPGMPPL